MLAQFETMGSKGLELFIDDAMWRIDTNSAGEAADKLYIDKQKAVIRGAANELKKRGQLRPPYSQYLLDIDNV